MRVLADGLTRALELAGLPAYVDLNGDVEQRAGAVIEVDTVDDDGGGVFVPWQSSSELLQESSSALLAGETSHPAIERDGRVSEIMVKALQELLTSAGFSVEPCDDEYRPYSLRARTDTH